MFNPARLLARHFCRSVVWRAAILAAGLAVVALAPLAATAAPAKPDDRTRAIEARFPDPQRLLADFPDQPERTAALIVMRDELYASNGKWAGGKVAAYNRAFMEVRAEQTRSGVALDNGGMTHDQRRLIYPGSGDPRVKPFRRMLFSKYLPGQPNSQATEDQAIRDEDQRTFAELRALAAGLAIILAVMIVPWIYVRMRYPRTGPPAVEAAPSGDPLTLPAGLAEVRLPRLSYTVEWIGGFVFDTKTWNKVEVDVTTSGGGVSVNPNVPANSPHLATVQPTTVETKIRNIRQDQIWVRDLNGDHLTWTFTGGAFAVAPGQIVSILTLAGKGDKGPTLLAYNHDTKQLETFRNRPLDAVHRVPGLPPWATATLFGTVGSLALRGTLGMTMRALAGGYSGLIAGLVPAIIVGGLGTLSVKAYYGLRRSSAYQRIYLPAYRRLFERATPELRAAFAGGMATVADGGSERRSR
jgi:hypothetical protein